jgi:hypothetical protein
VKSTLCLGYAGVGYLANSRTLQLRFYDRTDELMATEFLSPRRAIEIAGNLLWAAHQALGDGIAADEERHYGH